MASWRRWARISDPRAIGWLRLAIGLVQGLAFWALHSANEHKAWPATDPVLSAALRGAVFFVPFVWLAGLGSLRRWTLTAWLVAAAALAAGFAGYEVWRGADEARTLSRAFSEVPSFLATAAALFIGHHLIAGADEARRPIASYRLYFDAAWKHAVQLALSIAFVGAFWLVLELGAAMFAVIGIKALETAIHKPVLYFPAAAVAFAAGVHLSDVRAQITRGLRTIGLTLLSWLMPLMGLLAAAFLLALPFTGLQALWKVGHATAILLSASAALIILLNAAYQDGSEEARPPKLLQWLGRLTAIVLLPMAGLAGLGLSFRIGQHGLTPDRIIALGCLVAAACYAVGYAAAAVRPGRWLKGLETTNVVAAFVDLAILLALFTPIADPARLSAADQTARLLSGRTAPEAFDFTFLRFGAGRYGRDALQQLAKGGTGPHAADIAKRAQEALQSQSRWETPSPPSPQPSEPVTRLTARVVMHPAGAQLPLSFIHQAETNPGALTGTYACTLETPCRAYVLDLGPADKGDVLLGEPSGAVEIFRQDPDGSWSWRAGLGTVSCQDAIKALARGDVRLAAPDISDVVVGGRRYRPTVSEACGAEMPDAKANR